MIKKVKIIIGVLIILIAIFAILIFIWQKDSKQFLENKPTGIILFYGDTCPHCKVLEEWIKENNIEEKIEITKLEVYNNEDNRKLLVEKATECGITDNIGVPFLWTGTDCVVGDQLIEQFFQGKININESTATNTNETNNIAQ